ncbi:2,3-epoxybenzoyl-CoA dihydrolase [Anaeromyxobacter paludicola]|uniref:Benzoyl-CoA-dihydrodiol lyase n=1 Tax=Anaeromyxobacter paludicola TaxID=2918171 RepID=A0ABN6NBM1_9BACT|nr:2,3-epoxybenzoyl-CoA dihydrolase [Anaeromyxobacter paludicola]BDG10625.1 benzoyl-CoA-dihydrodiol lyase [Anaeromyxobacter paludicola]
MAISFETDPSRYRHWRLALEGPVARLGMDVREDAGLEPGYALKLNSYDLGVDLELADALQRLRFEHPEVKVLVVESLKDRVFCAGANIGMLGRASHPFKVNFCKETNETRLALEDASACSGLRSLAALGGTCAGGGYELALACDRILLVDDASSAVSLPEVSLLGVLPGTGGLTRLVDKRRVRRDLADAFATSGEGVKGKRALEWRLVDELVPRSRWAARVAEAAAELAATSDRPGGPGVPLPPLAPEVSEREVRYRFVTLRLEPGGRAAGLTVRAPEGDEPRGGPALLAAGAAAWALRAFRELDDALLRLRFHHPEAGTVLLRAEGDPARVLAADAGLLAARDHWLGREVLAHVKRVLKRLDATARTFFALVEPGSAFAGSLLELALAADRQYALDDPQGRSALWPGPMNAGPLPAASGLTRLEARFLGEPGQAARIAAMTGPIPARAALDLGLVTFAPDELDWDDEVRVAIEERASQSPDALTGLEQNLRAVGPETMETRIFGRLSAWQNWIFTRPSATGERGALTLYGKAGQRPEFDPRRT